MKPAPFEQFIKSLLDKTNCADALRNLAEKNIPLQGNNLMSAVDSILLEEAIEDFHKLKDLDISKMISDGVWFSRSSFNSEITNLILRQKSPLK